MNQFDCTITVLPVRGIDPACEWYQRVLGLNTRYRHEGRHAHEETNYAVLERDGVQVHLILDEPSPYMKKWTKAGTGYLYLRVKDVVAFHQQLQTKGIESVGGLKTASWGAKGFEISDIDGNHIRIEQAFRVTEASP